MAKALHNPAQLEYRDGQNEWSGCGTMPAPALSGICLSPFQAGALILKVAVDTGGVFILTPPADAESDVGISST
jgi:hypothetical protein